MEPIAAEELADLRSELETTFDKTATIERMTAPVSDGFGGVDGSTDDVAPTVPCRLIPIRDKPREGREGDKMGSVTRWKVLTAWDTGVKPGDRLRIDGIGYEVMEDNGDRSMVLTENVTVRRIK